MPPVTPPSACPVASRTGCPSASCSLPSTGTRVRSTARRTPSSRRPTGATCDRHPGKETLMDYGLFTMPSHPPERGLYDGHQWDLQQLRWADELGFSEAWIGEHHTAPWEP